MSWVNKPFFQEYLESLRVYREAIPAGVRAALTYGLLGGILVSWLAYLPARLYLNRLLTPPNRITDTTVWSVMGITWLILVGLLAFVLSILSQRFPASSNKERILTGTGVGFLFGLATHSSLIGSIIGVLTNRDMLVFLNGGFNAASSPEHLAIMTRTAYLNVSEGMGFALLTVGITTLAGALLGSLVLQVEQSSSTVVRDAFGPFFVLLMPAWFFILFIVLVVLSALLEPALRNSMQEAGLSYAPPIPMILIQVMPAMIGMLIVQFLSIGWLWSSDPTTLHRSLLRMTQVFYGIIWTIGFPVFLSMSNPRFVTSPGGMLVVGLSVICGIGYFILTQKRLRQAARAQVRIRIEIPARKVIAAGLWVTLIGCLLGDLLGGRQLYNMANILVRLIEPNGLSLNSLLNHALLDSFVFWAVLTAQVLVASLIPISVITFFAHAVERRRTVS